MRESIEFVVGLTVRALVRLAKLLSLSGVVSAIGGQSASFVSASPLLIKNRSFERLQVWGKYQVHFSF